ncbi:MAG: ATP-binding SpoIIE family protein phosphatase, partial [Mycobacterium sp.]
GARLSAAARERDDRRSRDAQARLALDFAQLDAALQGADSVTAIVAALRSSPVGSGDAAVVSVGVLDADANQVRFEYAGAVPAELRDRFHVAAMNTPLVPVEVIKSGEPMIITDTFDLAQHYQHVVKETADTVRACVSQPLRGLDGRVIGSFGLLWPTPREFDAAELEMFARAAMITQSALDRVCNMAREHRIAADFQEQLLDLDRGSTAAVVAAMYQPAVEEMRVGGDWYLVTPLEGAERVAVSVGDVVGHGLQTAIVMSKLRSAVAATALTDADPATVLAALDRYAASVAGARCATVGYAVVDTAPDGDSGVARIRYGCAGHPYPLVVAPGQAPVFLRDGRRPPVAAAENEGKPNTATSELPPGSLLLLYTDGLIERPGETLDQGFVRLQGAAAHCTDLPVGDVCAALLDRMRPRGGYTDDVVVLALRPVHSTAHSFVTVLPATLDQMADARHRLRRWLTGIGADPHRLGDVLLATGEAITNAVEHGSGGEAGSTVSIEAFVR